ncbi:hypothetical protein MoryE10_26140 [Methylogaea oryzae]|uniref:BLUF domain-containing protein n=2 Tax=Methylogaea oryzae TaxID=1295382 RepID=A0A8D4VPH3_9GAMM|nr:hypothetical protein MoryE10_26140 [Methylogaea oryzae]
MQVLEGDSKDVHEIYDAICRDERNTGNVKLFEHEIIRRDFPDWSMGFRNLDTCSPDELPGFIDIFNGKLDKQIAINNKMAVVDLMVGFAKKYK